MLEVDGVGMTYQPERGLFRLLITTASSGPVRALDDVSFTVHRGEVMGIVGANGAGKSTLLRAITTLLTPSEGEIRLNGVGLDPTDPRVRSSFGLSLPEDRAFYWRLTGRQNLRHFAALAGLDREDANQRIERSMTERGLADSDKAVFGYSSGMLAQLGLARAMLHEPSLLVLDEPTRSLDPLAGERFCREIRTLAEEDRAVLLASHRLDEVVGTCDRILVLERGRVAWLGSVGELHGGPAALRERLHAVTVTDAGGDAADGGPSSRQGRR